MIEAPKSGEPLNRENFTEKFQDLVECANEWKSFVAAGGTADLLLSLIGEAQGVRSRQDSNCVTIYNSTSSSLTTGSIVDLGRAIYDCSQSVYGRMNPAFHAVDVVESDCNWGVVTQTVTAGCTGKAAFMGVHCVQVIVNDPEDCFVRSVTGDSSCLLTNSVSGQQILSMPEGTVAGEKVWALVRLSNCDVSKCDCSELITVQFDGVGISGQLIGTPNGTDCMQYSTNSSLFGFFPGSTFCFDPLLNISYGGDWEMIIDCCIVDGVREMDIRITRSCGAGVGDEYEGNLRIVGCDEESSGLMELFTIPMTQTDPPVTSAVITIIH